MSLLTNLIWYLKFEGNSNDSVNSHNGTDTGITYSTGNGKILQGAGNGGTGKIEFAYNADMNITNNFTIAFWFKRTTLTGNSYLVSKLGGIDNNYAVIYGYSGDQAEFYGSGYTGSDPRTGTGISIADGNWHHIVYCYDGSTWEGYKDGANIFSVSRTFSLSTATTQGLKLFTYNGAHLSNGCMDEFGMWTRKLTSAEVSQLYNGGAGFTYPFLNSTAYYNFFKKNK